MRLYEINGDKNNSKLNKILIFFQIALDIIQEKKTKRNFSPDIHYDLISDIIGKNFYSPGRLASLNYLINFIYCNFEKDKLKILDLGCGSGRYHNWIKQILNNKEFKYLGIDLKENTEWENHKSENAKFLVKDLKSTKDLNFDFEPNFIFSQSVLEHAKDDKNLLRILIERYPEAKHLHIIPGSISGINYLAHGYRRYNFVELKNICSSFNIQYKIQGFSGKTALEDYFQWFDFEYKKNNKIKKHPFASFFSKKSNYNSITNLKSYSGIRLNEYPVHYALELN